MIESHTYFHRLRPWLPSVGGPLAYVVAAVAVLAGLLARWPLDALAGTALPPFITLYPSIVIAAFAGGVRAGMAAMLLSAAAAWRLWIEPSAPWPPDAVKITTVSVFLFAGTITVIASGAARLLLDDVDAVEKERARAARESVHRIKNLLAVVQSIARKISADAKDVPEFRDRLEARLRALAVAQDVLVQRDWQDVDLTHLIQAALGPFLPNPRLELKLGPAARAPSNAVAGLSMALYELATNSMKYGALGSPGGFVRLTWTLNEDRCALEWREIGMERPAVGGSGGLGALLVRGALSGVAEASVIYDLGPDAVTCLFEWPLPEEAAAGQ